MTRKVLVLGANGFLGRHIAFAFRSRGWRVLASARRTERLERMGFEVLAVDLAASGSHDPEFWRVPLAGADLVVAAGLLTGSEEALRAVHVTAPQAAYGALGESARAVLISAVGIEAAATGFARWRREGEAAALAAGKVAILRPGLVLGETSYGGSSLLRALAAMPFAAPVAGNGAQAFNPIHADDLAEAAARLIEAPPGPGPWEIGGPERVTQTEIVAAYRAWLGLRPAPVLRLPLGFARGIGRIGDALSLGPISATSVAQLDAGVEADPGPLLARTGLRPRGFSEILAGRPPGSQDLWQARLYLLQPLVRLVLAALWLVSGLVGLFAPGAAFLPALSGSGISDTALLALARAGGVLDLSIAALILANWRPRVLALAQLGVVAIYTLGLSALSPGLWLEPFGGLLKNLPILALLVVHLALAEER